MWEVFNRCVKGKYERPYDEFPNLKFEFAIILNVATKGIRPTIPNLPGKLVSLIGATWNQEKIERPDSVLLLEKLLDCHKDYKNDMNAWNQYIKEN